MDNEQVFEVLFVCDSAEDEDVVEARWVTILAPNPMRALRKLSSVIDDPQVIEFHTRGVLLEDFAKERKEANDTY
jgi:hypothetical protein